VSVGLETFCWVFRLQGLGPEDRLVYQLIKQADNNGIWTKDLRVRSNLQPAVLTKVLKNLETKKIVKSVKSVEVLLPPPFLESMALACSCLPDAGLFLILFFSRAKTRSFTCFLTLSRLGRSLEALGIRNRSLILNSSRCYKSKPTTSSCRRYFDADLGGFSFFEKPTNKTFFF